MPLTSSRNNPSSYQPERNTTPKGVPTPRPMNRHDSIYPSRLFLLPNKDEENSIKTHRNSTIMAFSMHKIETRNILF